MSLVTIVAREGNVLMFSAKSGEEVVEGISHYRIDNETLYLDQLHLEGSSAGNVGRKVLWETAKDLGRQHNVQKVVIQGGRRTTGKYSGQIPSLVTIEIE